MLVMSLENSATVILKGFKEGGVSDLYGKPAVVISDKEEQREATEEKAYISLPLLEIIMLQAEVLLTILLISA